MSPAERGMARSLPREWMRETGAMKYCEEPLAAAETRDEGVEM